MPLADLQWRVTEPQFPSPETVVTLTEGPYGNLSITFMATRDKSSDSCPSKYITAMVFFLLGKNFCFYTIREFCSCQTLVEFPVHNARWPWG